MRFSYCISHQHLQKGLSSPSAGLPQSCLFSARLLSFLTIYLYPQTDVIITQTLDNLLNFFLTIKNCKQRSHHMTIELCEMTHIKAKEQVTKQNTSHFLFFLFCESSWASMSARTGKECRRDTQHKQQSHCWVLLSFPYLSTPWTHFL